MGLVLLVLLLTGVTVMVHAVGVITLQRWLERAVEKRSVDRFWDGTKLLAKLVMALLVLHLAEMSLWSTVYRGFLGSWEEAIYFSATSYSTVGYGDIVLPPGWRMVGVAEAVVGVLMFGWSTGLLFAVAGRFQSALAERGGAAPAARRGRKPS